MSKGISKACSYRITRTLLKILYQDKVVLFKLLLVTNVSSVVINTTLIRIFVVWNRHGETQQMSVNVGFRSSIQPTYFCNISLTPMLYNSERYHHQSDNCHGTEN